MWTRLCLTTVHINVNTEIIRLLTQGSDFFWFLFCFFKVKFHVSLKKIINKKKQQPHTPKSFLKNSLLFPVPCSELKYCVCKTSARKP